LPWRGTIPQLFFFVVLPLTVLLVALPIGSLTLHAQAMRDLVGQRDRRAAQAAADALAEQMNHRATIIRSLAIHASTSTPDHALIGYDYLLADFESGLALVAPDGAVLASSGPNAVESWQGHRVTELLTQARAASQPLFSPAFQDAASGQFVEFVAAAVPQSPVVVVGAFFPASLCQRALGKMVTSTDPIDVWVVDVQRQVLYQVGHPHPEADLAQHPGVTSALQGQSGATYFPTGGGEHVVAFSPVSPVGWALIVEEPWEAVDNPLLRTTQAAPLVLIPAVLFAVIAFWFGIKQIVEPLQALEQKAAALGREQYEAIEKPVGGISEIRSLQQTLGEMARKIRAYQASIHSYLGMLTRGQEDERRRLARELHDDTVQALIALDQQAQLAQLALRKGAPEVGERLADVRRMTTALIGDIRRVVHALRPIYLEDLGLLPAMEMLVRETETAAGVQATFVTEGTAARLPLEHEIAVYRIAQEALNNIARHAGARTVEVRAIFEAGAFCLRIVDDGRGFTLSERVSDMAAGGHYGLMGMQERADLMGARLTLQSAPGHGTTVELRLSL
jgi:signal transduction histidine kinase